MSTVRQPGRGTPRSGRRREELLRTVIRIVARDGIDALTFRTLAEEANCAYGLAAYYFGSREEMLDEGLLLCVKEHQERVDATLGAATLDEFADRVPELISEIRDNASFQFMMILLSRRNKTIGKRLRAAYETYFDALGRSLEHLGVPTTPERVALVFAALDGLVLQQLLHDDPRRTERALAELRELLRGLQPTKPR